MTTLPSLLYRAEQVRKLDQIAIDDFGIPGIELMERAGKAAFNALRWQWPAARHIVVLCGVGNNGGDGFVLARLADEVGMDASVQMLGAANRLRGDALLAFNKLAQSKVTVQPFDTSLCEGGDVIVDAMLGTGLSGSVQDQWKLAINWVNQMKHHSGSRVMSLDIPSGLQADTGCVMGVAVQADFTVTFIAVKQGLLTACGPDYCGQLRFDDLQVDTAVYQSIKASARALSKQDMQSIFRRRNRESHKRDYGHVLIVGGNWGMPGAVHLAAKAALRAGAGMVSVATRPEHVASIVSTCPELMCHGINSALDLQKLLTSVTSVAIGPGLGQDVWARELLGVVLQSALPLVIDADALNLLAKEPAKRENWVLTPHPGEAGRLLAMTASQIQADRFNAVSKLQSKYGGVVVLKGCGTLVCSSADDFSSKMGIVEGEEHEQDVWICLAGNPGMASAGMGDVLTGLVSATIAQSVTTFDANDRKQACNAIAQQKSALKTATRAAVYLHSLCADIAACNGERGMLASDLFPIIYQKVNEVGCAE
ncbi:MAG: NAD(P)H-hydrate dehydratase [Gammaproteobacteria bacterium]|nr:NAD(P)H-hydrate dehydratase [Gammaproteobacteria bacterium]